MREKHQLVSNQQDVAKTPKICFIKVNSTLSLQSAAKRLTMKAMTHIRRAESVPCCATAFNANIRRDIVALIETLNRLIRKEGKAIAVAATLVATLLASAPADAASLCERLRGRLNSAVETIGSTSQVRAYQRSISQQNREILKVRSDLRAYGCSSGSIVVFGGPNQQACDTLSDALDHMLANLNALKDHQDNLSSKTVSDSSRRQILAALDANGCNDVNDGPSSRDASAAPTIKANYGPDDNANAVANSENYQIRNLGGAAESGTLQTVCVRTCDGGFFPISSNASPTNFARDAKVCSMMCPGMETQLFYHDVGSQESGEMVSATDGKPYQDHAFSYKYRLSPVGGTKACGCNFPAYYQEMMRRESESTAPDSKPQNYSSITGLDKSVTDMSPLDSGALDKGLGDLRKTNAKPPVTQPPITRPYDPSKQHVRQVGPTFVPAEEKSIHFQQMAGGAADQD